MKLLSFRIRNFRSIVDTGWHNLSLDNITGLIGQNESGKTSILEALYGFYNGRISEDVLRSDLTLPAVACRFSLDGIEVEKVLREKLLPEGVLDQIRKDGAVCLERVWNEDLSSRILLGGEEVIRLFERHERQAREREEQLVERLEEVLDKKARAIAEFRAAEQSRLEAEKQLEELKNTLSEMNKALKNVKAPDAKKKGEEQLSRMKKKVSEAKDLLQKKTREAHHRSKQVQQVSEEARLAEQARELLKEYEDTEKELEQTFRRLTTLQRMFDHALTDKEKRAIRLELDGVNDRYIKLMKERDLAWERAVKKRHLAYKVLEGYPLSTAEKEVEREQPHLDPYYSRLEAGNALFEYIPEFVFFEDFSSLLPNRIDLEDILTGNTGVEGYKAARNFLQVAGLDEEFFRETSNRILKQKIERLNRELTVDFQDFWQQRIGRHNKIALNFELEHYDHSHPEKSGYPYIEFWVKDRQERLYPKQRSRGVRWFLSFYLELKAAVSQRDFRGKVLLIDEPGLSLHARAQEDVLKVFEHIKEKIQIIYTTHSPHLIDIRKLYRLLAVQRSSDDVENSETVVFDAKSLTSASADTLSPVYTLMGSRLSEQQFIQKKNNVILEDLTNYYYFSAFHSLLGYPEEVFFLPATDVSNVETLVNLLMGWGLEFIVVTDASPAGERTYEELKKNIFWNDEKAASEKMVRLGFPAVEDLFSTLDFKKHVLHQRIGIPESNSEYVIDNKLSRTLLASNFMKTAAGMKITDLDEETRENIERVFREIADRLQGSRPV